jgi:hypothetical protein
MSTNKFEEKAREIVDQVLDYSEFVSAISSALEAAYQEGRESEAAMNELVKIGQEIDNDPTDV